MEGHRRKVNEQGATEGGTSEDTKRNQPIVIASEVQREGQVRTQKESDRGRGTHESFRLDSTQNQSA